MSQSRNTPTITITSFGHTSSEEEVFLYTLKNVNGICISISNYGGVITECWVPDREGELNDVVLGYKEVSAYIENSPYFGAIIGRCGNRIGGPGFDLEGVHYDITPTSGPGEVPLQLHGGVSGFDKKIWQANSLIRQGEPVLELRYRSVDGDEGYPGNLDVLVTYSLTDDNELKIEYSAVTDKATPVNLTNHSYFNLKGEGNGDILDHEVSIRAQAYTEIGADLLPTGNLPQVKDTPFDLRSSTVIGSRIDEDFEQLKFAGGFDHNFVLENTDGTLALVAEVYEPRSGRLLEVLTQEPGIQFYCGNFLDGSCVGKRGLAYKTRNAFCLETQHFPDSVNQSQFPSIILKPGETYETTTIYRFGVKQSRS